MNENERGSREPSDNAVAVRARCHGDGGRKRLRSHEGVGFAEASIHMTSTRTILGALFVGSLFAAGCGDDPAAIVGSWRAQANALDSGTLPVGDRQVLTFLADGTITAGGFGAGAPGTYTVAGDRVTMVTPRQDAGPDSQTMTFHASDTRLVLDVMTSADAGDGLSGTWHGTRVNNGSMIDTTVILRGDQTGRFESRDSASGGSIAIEATWEQQGDDVAVRATVSPDQLIAFYATRVDGVLGSSYERLAE